MSQTNGSKPAEKDGAKREAIRRKVEQSQAQLERVSAAQPSPPEGLKALAMDYPFALIVGGMAVGMAIGSLLPRTGANRLVSRAAALAGVAGELGAVFGRQALDRAGKTAGRLEDLGETLGDNAAEYSRRAAGLLSEVAEKAAESVQDVAQAARDKGREIGRQSVRLRSHLRH